MIAVLTYPRFRQQNNEVMSMKSAAMTLANLLSNQALLASNISSLITNPLNIESYRQIVKCKSVFCLSRDETAISISPHHFAQITSTEKIEKHDF